VKVVTHRPCDAKMFKGATSIRDVSVPSQSRLPTTHHFRITHSLDIDFSQNTAGTREFSDTTEHKPNAQTTPWRT
jgi:hypothetical protein